MRAEPTEPRFVFFGGKGGVGKTTCAAATALGLASKGERVLLVTLDPARALGDTLGVELGPDPRRVPVGRGRLEAFELDADRALERWLDARRRVLQGILERGTYLDPGDVARFLRLSLPGVDELVGLHELERVAREREPDVVVVDTAPQGHTLRLLATPGTLRRIARVLAGLDQKHRVLVEALGGRERPDEASELVRELDEDGARLARVFRDPARSEFRWVLLPETLAFEEARDGVRALESDGFPVGRLVVNRVTPPPPGSCAHCRARRRAEAAVVAELRAELGQTIPLVFLPALETEPRGRAGLGRVAKALEARGGGAALVRRAKLVRGAKLVSRASPRAKKSSRARDEGAATELPLEVPEGVRLLLFGGKGGVGKTTCAAAAALALAHRWPRRRVLLLSVDPAHSLGDALATTLGDDERAVPGGPKNLRARELDAALAFATKREGYREAVDELFDVLRGGSRFDAVHDRAIVRDLMDLAPPGLDELFAVLSVTELLAPPRTPAGGEAREVSRPRLAPDLVVLDTAPTGHALRLLESPAAAHEWAKTLLAVLLKYRSVTGLGGLGRDLLDLSRGLSDLRALLADPVRTRFVAVARAEGLARRETGRLLAALGGLRIPVEGVIWNALTPEEGCARCRRARAREEREVAALETSRGKGRARASLSPGRARIAAPAQAPPPRGAASLLAWGRAWRPLAPGSLR